eukprot:scaffold127371_cov19-Tisochrysis_lutea.AAC.1
MINKCLSQGSYIPHSSAAGVCVYVCALGREPTVVEDDVDAVREKVRQEVLATMEKEGMSDEALAKARK